MPTHGRPQLRLAPPLSGTADGVGFPLRSRRITLSHSSNFRGKFRLAHGFDRRHLLVKLGNGQSPNIIPRADLAPLDEHAVKLAAEKLGGADRLTFMPADTCIGMRCHLFLPPPTRNC